MNKTPTENSAGAHTPGIPVLGPYTVVEREAPLYAGHPNPGIECLICVGPNENHGNAFAIVSLGGRGATSHRPKDVRAAANLLAAAPEMLTQIRSALDEIEMCRSVLMDYAHISQKDVNAVSRRIEKAGAVIESLREITSKASGGAA